MLSVVMEDVPENQKKSCGRSLRNLARMSVEFTLRQCVVGASGDGELDGERTLWIRKGVWLLLSSSIEYVCPCHLPLFSEPCPFHSSSLHPVS